jgi:hypothetical protein
LSFMRFSFGPPGTLVVIDLASTRKCGNMPTAFLRYKKNRHSKFHWKLSER